MSKINKKFEISSLLCLVGRKYVADKLVCALESFDLKRENILKISAESSYTIILPQLGLELLLQCLEPAAASDPIDCALLGVTFRSSSSFNSTAVWDGPWPADIQNKSFYSSDAKNLFGPDFVMMGNVGHVELLGHFEVIWTVVCEFSIIGPLESLMILASDEPLDFPVEKISSMQDA